MLKGVLTFVCGAAIGSVVTWYFTKKIVEKKAEERRVSEISSLQEYIDKLRAMDENGDLTVSLNYVPPKEEEAAKESYDQLKMRVGKNHIGKDGKIDYGSFYDGKEEKTVAVDIEAEMAEKEHPEDDENMVDSYFLTKEANSEVKSKIIRAEQMDDPDYEHHEKVTLYYFTEDQILTDADENPIYDVEILIGDALTKYGFDHNDEEVIYVRNFSHGVDYEIAKVFGSYAES